MATPHLYALTCADAEWQALVSNPDTPAPLYVGTSCTVRDTDKHVVVVAVDNAIAKPHRRTYVVCDDNDNTSIVQEWRLRIDVTSYYYRSQF